MSKQINNTKSNVKRNVIGITVHGGGFVGTKLMEFGAQIDNPYYVKHNKATVMLDLKSEYCGMDTSKERAEEEKKFAEVNAAVDAARDKQIRFILAELAKKTERKPEEEVEKYFKENPTPTQANFFAAVKALRSDKNDPKTRKIGDAEMDKIIDDSSIVGVGPLEVPKPEHVKLMVENDTYHLGLDPKYREAVIDASLREAGYTKKDLDNAFNECFVGYYPMQADYEEIRDARKQLITAKLNALPEKDRTEAAFVQECDKLDYAMKIYVLPKHAESKPDADLIFQGSMTKDAHEQFALENTAPTAVANEVETHFNWFMKSGYPEIDDPSEGVDIAVTYIKHLEDIHKKRPFWTRFADYFKRGGEDSTIKRMKKALAKASDLSAQEVDEKVRTSKLKYVETSYENRFRMLTEEKKTSSWNPAERIADSCFKAVDAEIEANAQKTKQNEELRAQIVETQKAKETEQTVVNDRVENSKDLQQNKEHIKE